MDKRLPHVERTIGSSLCRGNTARSAPLSCKRARKRDVRGDRGIKAKDRLQPIFEIEQRIGEGRVIAVLSTSHGGLSEVSLVFSDSATSYTTVGSAARYCVFEQRRVRPGKVSARTPDRDDNSRDETPLRSRYAISRHVHLILFSRIGCCQSIFGMFALLTTGWRIC